MSKGDYISLGFFSITFYVFIGVSIASKLYEDDPHANEKIAAYTILWPFVLIIGIIKLIITIIKGCYYILTDLFKKED